MSDPATPPPIPPPMPEDEPVPPTGGSGLKLALIIVGCIAAAGIVLAIFLSASLHPRLKQARSLARKAACMANLNGIGKSVELYKESFHQGPPLINAFETRDPETPIRFATTDLNPDTAPGAWTSGKGDMGPNAMQNVWLMMKEDLVPEMAFICPADSAYTDRESPTGAPRKYGWSDSSNFSYGMQSPYDANGNMNPWAEDMNGSVVVFADKNPGGPLTATRKPSNHKKLGTAYLIAAGSVGFHDDPTSSMCGMNGDDIYSVQDAYGGNTDEGGVPANDDDTYICKPGN
jgi:hypothetical protein